MGRLAVAWIALALCAAASFAATGSDALGEGLETAEGVDRVAALNELARKARENAPDESIVWAEQAIALAGEIGDDAGRARALNHLGIARYYLSEYDRALAAYEQGLSVAERIGLDETVSGLLNNIGIIHYIRGDYERALEYYSRALEIRRELGDREGLAKGYNNLGNVYYSAGRYEESLEYYANSIAIYEELGNQDLVASSLNNIALVYHALGRYDEALAKLERALEIAERVDHRPTIAMTLNSLGNVAAAQDRPDEALGFHRRALEVRRELGDRRGEADALLSIGQLRNRTRAFDEARGVLTEVVELAAEIQVREIERDAWEALATAYAGSGEFERALDAHRNFKRVNDELFNEQASRRLSELEARADLAAKNREIDDLQARQRLQRLVRNISVASAVLLLLLMALLYGRLRLIRRTNEAMRIAQAERERAARAELAHVARVSTLGEMASALAHELNQPLTAILSNAQTTRRLVAEGRGAPDLLEGALDDIVEGSGRAREIILRLRSLIRRGEVTAVPVAINDVVRDVEPFARANARSKGVSLTIRTAADLPTIEADPIQLQQVALNLVNNGAEAMAAGDTDEDVLVTTSLGDSGEVVVSVRDAGPPVDEDVLRRMFEPFFTTKSDGLGMGLAICRTIVEAQGGRLWAERNADRGLTVRFAIPAAGSATATGATSAGDRTGTPEARAGRVR